MKSNNRYQFKSGQLKALCQLDPQFYIDCFFVNQYFESEFFLVLQYLVSIYF